MKLQRALMDDFICKRDFYDDVVTGTVGMDKHARWKQGSHPTDETIRDYIGNGNMYMCMDGIQLIGAMAIPMEQGEDYHPVNWDVEAADNEVATLHIFAVAPECQGRGLGKQMIRMAMDMARDNGMKAFRLDTLASNIPAQKMYDLWDLNLKENKISMQIIQAGLISFTTKRKYDED